MSRTSIHRYYDDAGTLFIFSVENVVCISPFDEDSTVISLRNGPDIVVPHKIKAVAEDLYQYRIEG